MVNIYIVFIFDGHHSATYYAFTSSTLISLEVNKDVKIKLSLQKWLSW